MTGEQTTSPQQATKTFALVDDQLLHALYEAFTMLSPFAGMRTDFYAKAREVLMSRTTIEYTPAMPADTWTLNKAAIKFYDVIVALQEKLARYCCNGCDHGKCYFIVQPGKKCPDFNMRTRAHRCRPQWSEANELFNKALGGD
jgi:hypothetical protein